MLPSQIAQGIAKLAFFIDFYTNVPLPNRSKIAKGWRPSKGYLHHPESRFGCNVGMHWTAYGGFGPSKPKTNEKMNSS